MIVENYDNERGCKNCQFFHKSEGSRGYCKRYPPTPVVVENRVCFPYPIVNDDEQCGEFLEIYDREGKEIGKT